MRIVLNNTPEDIEVASMTIRQLLQYKNFTFKMLVIKVNGNLIPKQQYDEQIVSDGDEVMILHLVSGG